ncbi:hypothetical protein C7H09_01635 [Marinobacter fuscus]|uniref:Uncharacterized protein n=1 Tax=Marinobacter fuscus TaxID=2109942 RepID=A0A2T1KU62_9GAMM|nr:hypothetical protein C7H09_01635 [Marinobacter fuscus]
MPTLTLLENVQLRAGLAGQIIMAPDGASAGAPRRWRLQVADFGVDLRVSAPPGDYYNQGLYPYWESPVRVEGSHTGVGYMELTGYHRTAE